MHGLTQHLSFCAWLVSLSTVASGLIHVTGGVGIFFLLKAQSYSVAWRDHVLLIGSSISGCLRCFYLLALVSNAAVNTGL